MRLKTTVGSHRRIEEAMRSHGHLPSRPGPGDQKEWVRRWLPDQFVCQPGAGDPGYSGARIVATGRADFLNQVNNSVCFPGIFCALMGR